MDLQKWIQISELARNYGLLAGGGLGLLIAWLRVRALNRQAAAQVRQADASTSQNDLARRKLVGELFNQAISQLRDEKLEIRLLAIYTLRDIAEKEPDSAPAVIELVTAYLRANNALWAEGDPPIDIQEMMRLIAPTEENDE